MYAWLQPASKPQQYQWFSRANSSHSASQLLMRSPQTNPCCCWVHVLPSSRTIPGNAPGKLRKPAKLVKNWLAKLENDFLIHAVSSLINAKAANQQLGLNTEY
jgi:hypothetical protein